MPQHPIYIDLLPESARAVIGHCHKDGEGARRLLEWEGFSFSNVVDIFDGGPLMTVQRDHIRTLREARRVRVACGGRSQRRQARLDRAPAHPAISAAPRRARWLRAAWRKSMPRHLAALGLNDGDEALIWVSDAH